MLTKIRLQRVRTMPSTLEQGVLYVSEEFETAAHLCACGCGSKVRTPLGPTEWTFTDDPRGPSLSPSVGNWQKPCRSHYVIKRGQIYRSGKWSEEQVLAGRAAEERRRQVHYDSIYSGPWWKRLGRWLGSLFR
ncbi:DUF6527 family protein [Novosphingobium sp.]|uniref:DUF6527 family protein n=1 Tax=Novosphingobium sp. TaxID=1874826 RepID=UPI0038BC6A12